MERRNGSFIAAMPLVTYLLDAILSWSYSGHLDSEWQHSLFTPTIEPHELPINFNFPPPLRYKKTLPEQPGGNN